jgi:hypothetical protein
MLNPTFIGILGCLAIAACWLLAVLLFRVGAPGSRARKLSVLLVIEGACLATAGFPEFALGVPETFYEQNVWLGIGSAVLHFLADAAIFALYPAFLAAALQTPLTRPFGRTDVRVAFGVVGLGLWVTPIVSYMVWNSGFGSGLLYMSMMSVFIFALVAAIDAWRRAEPGLARTRAGAFAIAFGVRDICWGFTYGASFYMTATTTFSTEFDLFWIVKLVYALGTLIAVPLIAYGILRGYLFDIDLKIRWTIKQSTVAAIFVSVFFLISEGANRFLEAEIGGWAGLVAAAALMFVLNPLQQFAERIASSAMPKTENTPEYIAFRKMQVYENALAEALEEGGISGKERTLLNHLRESLGISNADGEAIEAELKGRSKNMAAAAAT